MQYRRATTDDIDSLIALQNSYHIANVSRNEKSDGFLNTVLPAELLRTVINDECAVFVAEAMPVQQINEEQSPSGQKHAGQTLSGDTKSESVPEIVAMAVCASWGFWSFSESLNRIAEQLVHVPYNKGPLTQSNSYFWGPVCVSKACRGQGVFEGLFTFSLNAMQPHYPFVYTYVHTDNLRSYVAHTEKADFVFTQHIAINGQMFCEMVRETTT
ncbi:acetyltransferase GNAT family [Photobacterium aphoticum]|uniref:Acetyltransferase GNAT family n=1 Tax=Photobacterium aphoticum TaxID=754436 RepID=A0A090QLR8_9GAMM|nr:acetyltransferase GNAT family [Photobacterium aphoticum]